MRRFRPLNTQRPVRSQRGSVELAVLMVLIGLVVLGSLLDQMIAPENYAQRRAAELFANSWSRAELNASPAARPAWQAYRACWVAREGRPFVNTGDSLLAWAVHPAITPASPTPPSSDAADPTLMVDESEYPDAQAPSHEFTAEDLFDLCRHDVASARSHDPQEPLVQNQIRALLSDREKDVIAMAPRVSADPSSSPPAMQTANTSLRGN